MPELNPLSLAHALSYENRRTQQHKQHISNTLATHAMSSENRHSHTCDPPPHTCHTCDPPPHTSMTPLPPPHTHMGQKQKLDGGTVEVEVLEAVSGDVLLTCCKCVANVLLMCC